MMQAETSPLQQRPFRKANKHSAVLRIARRVTFAIQGKTAEGRYVPGRFSLCMQKQA
jgi:hypothetical protein